MARATNRANNSDVVDAEIIEETPNKLAVRPNYDAEALRSLNSFDSVLSLMGETFGTLDDASDVFGDGFRLMSAEDKAKLVGKPMALLEWSFYPSEEHGGEFCAIRIVAQEDNGTIGKYIVNDGSTGLAKTLREYTTRTGKQGGLLVRRGFRESEYQYCSDCRAAVNSDHADEEPGHKIGRARTYYFDTSA